MILTATHDGHDVEIRPVPHGWLGQVFRISINGDTMSGDYAYLSDAKEAAEERIGVALNWTEEPTAPADPPR